MKQIKFLKEPKGGFYETLRFRVNTYFAENKLDRFADMRSIIKSFVFFCCFVGFYNLILHSATAPLWLFFIYWFLMGMFILFTGMSIIHDAAHGTFSKHRWVNEILLRFMNLVGADGYIYRYKHRVSHHTFTNIPGYDIDLEQSSVVKVTPFTKTKKRHKYQHWYMRLLYPLSFTIFWLMIRDFKYYKLEYIGTTKAKHPSFQLILLTFSKLFYFFYVLFVPWIILPHPFWMILIGFLLLHLGSGVVAMFALLSNHVVEDSVFILPDANGYIHCSWGEHQLRTTDDFSPSSAFITFMFSGLNLHTAHHLFPNYCHHAHLSAITRIMRETAKEFGLQYRYRSLTSALISHFRLLKNLRLNPDNVFEITR
ncbi:MAG: fatty acid desaturase [Bacteroidales bacterium]